MLYGFSYANHCGEQAWFHTEKAAQSFAEACGWTSYEIEKRYEMDVQPEDIMDREYEPWTKEGRPVNRPE